mmetsp:Transcript_14446/g.34958  ORF Transcript_14446/g.34958 Transcript_14446/m.34958 type:complete len:451 (+) Transcript_14446:114-1466(+)
MPCGGGCNRRSHQRRLRCIVGLCIAVVAVFNAYIATYHHNNHHADSIFSGGSDWHHDFSLSSKASRASPSTLLSSQSLISSPTLPQLDRNNTLRRVLFVHIGKTGGETIRQTLRVACHMRQNPNLQESCLAKFKNDPSLGKTPLNQKTIGTIHCLLMVPANALSKASTLLVSVRNPIERVISWFRYLHPANCNSLVDKQSTACNVKKALRRERKEVRKRKKKGGKGNTKPSWTTRFFECFDSLPQVGLALMKVGGDGDASATAKTPNNCSALAQKTIRGAASPISSHMHFNYEYYWNQTLTLRPELETMVVRTEFLWQDLDHVQSLLHNDNDDDSLLLLQDGNDAVNTTTTRYKLPPRNNHTHGSESHRHVDSISGPALQYLCCALSREIYFYAQWIHRAVNLDKVDKQTAMDGVTKYCNNNNKASSANNDLLVWTAADLATMESILCTT